jgi:aromatic ring-opening dioxygenase catalytic subunit (LigB family)
MTVISRSLKKMMPVYFISHGSPMMAITPQDATHQFLQQLGKELQGDAWPKAIISVSAHWETPEFMVQATHNPETIYDFHHTIPALRSIAYPAQVDQELVGRIQSVLQDAGINFETDTTRGYDHGTWIPFHIMWPGERVPPTVQVSIHTSLDPRAHIELGKALASLRQEGYVIVASGGITHSFDPKWDPVELATKSHEFSDWVHTTLTTSTGEERCLMMQDFYQTPSGPTAHEREEHFIPMMVAVGASGNSTANRIHNSWFSASFSGEVYRFD